MQTTNLSCIGHHARLTSKSMQQNEVAVNSFAWFCSCARDRVRRKEYPLSALNYCNDFCAFPCVHAFCLSHFSALATVSFRLQPVRLSSGGTCILLIGWALRVRLQVLILISTERLLLSLYLSVSLPNARTDKLHADNKMRQSLMRHRIPLKLLPAHNCCSDLGL